MEEAITVWIDESTEIQINGQDYNLVGYLITNSDSEEFSFLNKLKQARKINQTCWTSLHGHELRQTDTRKLGLLDRWIQLFKDTDNVYYHAFLYRRNNRYIPRTATYEHYFAKQSVFSLANKMKSRGYLINTMFEDVSTLSVLFANRRSHSAGTTGGRTTRVHNLEQVYKNEISRQIHRISGKDPNTNQITVRFSFITPECFDAMQLSDCLLYLIRKKIEQGDTGPDNVFTELFDKHFLDDLDPHTRAAGFQKIYEFSKKFNFFESTA